MKNFVLNHKEIIIFCMVIIIISGAWCFDDNDGGYNDYKPMKTAEDKVREEAKTTAEKHVISNYAVRSIPTVNISTVRKISDEKYKVYGKINATDNYGDSFSGNFDGDCTVDDRENISCDFNYSKLLRN